MNQSLSTSRIEFDPKNKKQVEESKTLFRRFMTEGQVLQTIGGKDNPSFRECMEDGGFMVLEKSTEGFFYFRIYDKTGDTRLPWNSQDPEQVAEARKRFEEYAAKGWRAYTVSRHNPGQRGARVLGFSEDLEEVIFDDVTLDDKLGKLEKCFTDGAKKMEESRKSMRSKIKDFFKVFEPNVQMLPRTTPG